MNRLTCLILAAFWPFLAASTAQTPIEEAAGLLAAKKPQEALTKLESVAKDTEWFWKARFLKAKILTDLKQHESAAAIYAEEAARLFALQRKDSLAAVLTDFADELSKIPGPQDVETAKPNFPAAMELYNRALAADLSPSRQEEIQWKAVTAARRGKLYEAALKGLQGYLALYDADWTLQTSGLTIPNPPVEGKQRYAARMQLVEMLMHLNRAEEAKRQVEHILRLAKGNDPKSKEIAGDAAWLKILLRDPRRNPASSQPVPQQQSQSPAQGAQGDSGPNGEAGVRGEGGPKGLRADYEPWTPLSAYRNFTKQYPTHRKAPEAAREVARILAEQNDFPAAQNAWQEFIEGKGFQFVETEENRKPDPVTGKSEVDQLNLWKQEGVFEIGSLLLKQRKHSDAIAQFQKYTAQYPNGAQWAEAQRLIIDAEFELGLEAVSNNDEKLAAERFDAFLTKYPLDTRAARILFIYGQFPHAEALRKEEAKAPAAETAPLFQKAIDTWARLLSKYPGSEEASLALYNTAIILSDKLGKLDEGLATFKRVRWGNWAALAKTRAAVLSDRSLTLATERSFRVGEKAVIKTAVRNIEKLRFSQYFLNLEAYFRKQHSTDGIDTLDLDLIEADKTWESAVPGFAKYKGFEQSIDVPFPDGKPGVCVIRADGEDWQAATLVIRSDIDLIVQAAGKEALVLVVDRAKNAPVTDAEVLVSDGKKIVATGKTGADGVYRTAYEKGDATSLRVFAKCPQGVAAQQVGISHLSCGTDSPHLANIYTEKSSYLPGQTLNFQFRLRKRADGKLTTPAGKKLRLWVLGLEGRLLQEQPVELDAFGMAAGSFVIPEVAPAGNYRLRFEEIDKPDPKKFEGTFSVVDAKPETVRLVVRFTKPWVLRGEVVQGTISAADAWGEPIRQEPLHLSLPDGRILRQATNAEGVLAFEFDPVGFDIETELKFTANLVNRGVQRNRSLPVKEQAYGLSFTMDTQSVVAGVPFSLDVFSSTPDGKPVAAQLTMEFLKPKERLSHQVLEGVPWISYNPTVPEPTVVQTLALKTDEKEGKVKQLLTLAEAGEYVLRITGKDDLGKPIVIESSISVHGEKAANKVHFVSGDVSAPAGGVAKLNLHSRIASPLALLTVQAETILQHKLIPLQAGLNALEISVGSDHAIVQVTVSLLDGSQLHVANSMIGVNRALQIQVKKRDDGSEKIEVLTPGGQPVESRIYQVFLQESMAEGISSGQVAFELPSMPALASSAGFRHNATPKKVNREAADQKERFMAATSDQQRILEAQRGELALNTGNSVLERVAFSNYANNGFIQRDDVQAGEVQMYAGSLQTGLRSGSQTIAINAIDGLLYNGAAFPVTPSTPGMFNAEFDPPQIPQIVGGGRAEFQAAYLENENDSLPEATRIQHRYYSALNEDPNRTIPNVRRIVRAFGKDLAEGVLVQPAELPKAAVPVPLAATIHQEGDQAAPLQRSDRAKYEPLNVPPVTNPLPRGLRTDTSGGGILPRGETTVKIVVPEGATATVQVEGFATVGQFLAHAAKSQPDASLGNQLLALLSAPVRDQGVLDAAKVLVSGLAATQKDGGWPWQGIASLPADTLTSSTTYWALLEAKNAGIHVSDKLIERAEKFLTSGYSGIPADDNEKKAVVLHALSVGGKADFSNCNRLHRERETLTETALAFMAATFARMERPELARELLTQLEKKAVAGKSLTGTDLAQWPGSSKVARLNEPELCSAMALWTYAKLDKANKLAAQSAAFLLQSRALAAGTNHRNHGPVIAALAEYFRETPAAGEAKISFWLGNAEQKGEIRLSAGTHDLLLKNAAETDSGAWRILISQYAPKWTDPKSWSRPEVASREYLHARIHYNDRPLKAESASPVAKAEFGQRIEARLKFHNTAVPYPGFLMLEETLPAGCYYVPDSLKGNHQSFSVAGNTLRLMFSPGNINEVTYQMAAMVPGTYLVAPTVLRDAHKPTDFRLGPEMRLAILKPGEKSDEAYQTSHQEHFELANLKFADERYEDSLTHLETLFRNDKHREIYERELARMLLWALAARKEPDHKRFVDVFELLSERHPDLVVPFDKILKVAESYRKLGEFERSSLAFVASIDGGFVSDAGLSTALGKVDFLGSIDYQERLWKDYPDHEDEIGAHFALAQTLFNRANDAEKLPVRTGKPKLAKNQLLERARDLVRQFLRSYPVHGMADDASFSLTNIFFALKDYPQVVTAAESGANAHPTSEFVNSFQYMAALGHFWQFHYDDALRSASPVANGETKDRDYARYITAQIHHAQGKAAEAISWYERIKDLYPDAKAALAYFQDREISMPEITSFKPGEKVTVKIDYRNIKEASLQIYKVNLMRLYLREKNLSNITAVNLAGIEPESELATALGNGQDYDIKQQKEIELPVKDDGAYLIIARGDDHFTSGLVLVTPLKLDIQEDVGAGSIRVNVKDSVKGGFLADAEVKAIGSNSNKIEEGTTDPRGLFEATNLSGNATVIVRSKTGQFAFFRGEKEHQGGAKDMPADADPAQQSDRRRMVLPSKADYLKNVDADNDRIQKGNIDAWESKKESGGKGVQLEKFKK